MKKQILLRSLIAAPVGLAISMVITICVSLGVGDGGYYPVVPALAQQCGGELNAVIAQTVISLLYGAMFGGASVIWEAERWSLLRQTATHLGVVSVCTLPVAWFMLWMEHSAVGVLKYFGIFLGIYGIIWLSITLSVRRSIERINQSLPRQ